MAKFVVQALNRPGFDGSFRGGRKWPSATPTPVEVVEQPNGEDPPHDETKGLRIGTKTFKMLQADANLRVMPEGDQLKSAGDMDTLRAENERLQQEIRQLKGGSEVTVKPKRS